MGLAAEMTHGVFHQAWPYGVQNRAWRKRGFRIFGFADMALLLKKGWWACGPERWQRSLLRGTRELAEIALRGRRA